MNITSRTTNADIECVLLARCGFSYKFIEQKTGLTKSQIALRIRQTGSQIKNYRNGTTALADRVADSVHDDVNEQLKLIKKSILKQLKVSSSE